MNGEVYTQSLWIVMQVAQLYYKDGLSGVEIAQRMGLSASTVSRLLNKARAQNIISFSLAEPYMECLRVAEELKKRYGLREAIVVPTEGGIDDNRRTVALEGARYLQRVIADNDVLGVAWGRTMSYVIQVLNPCLKSNNTIVTLHGNISKVSHEFNPETLVSRIAMAYGGEQYCFKDDALCRSAEELEQVLRNEDNRKTYEMLKKVTISITGCGSLYPYPDSPLLTPEYHYLTSRDLNEIRTSQACGDMLLRFFDNEGQECDTNMRERTLGISLKDYKEIPTRVMVSADRNKSYTVRALLRGGLANVVILDQSLASKVLD